MIPDYHTSGRSGTAKLAWIDCSLMAVAIISTFWYMMVPSFWEAATDGKPLEPSFWLTWYPSMLVVTGAVLVGAVIYWVGGPTAGGLDRKTRTAFVLALGFVTVLMVRRVVTIQDFGKEQEAYLDRCASYLKEWDRRRQELGSELSVCDHELSMILERDRSESRPEIRMAVSSLRDRVDEALETVTNLNPDLNRVQEQAAKVESVRAHDFRAAGESEMEYRSRLAARQPGAELLKTEEAIPEGENSWPEATDPLIRVEAIALAAQVVLAVPGAH